MKFLRRMLDYFIQLVSISDIRKDQKCIKKPTNKQKATPDKSQRTIKEKDNNSMVKYAEAKTNQEGFINLQTLKLQNNSNAPEKIVKNTEPLKEEKCQYEEKVIIPNKETFLARQDTLIAIFIEQDYKSILENKLIKEILCNWHGYLKEYEYASPALIITMIHASKYVGSYFFSYLTSEKTIYEKVCDNLAKHEKLYNFLLLKISKGNFLKVNGSSNNTFYQFYDVLKSIESSKSRNFQLSNKQNDGRVLIKEKTKIKILKNYTFLNLDCLRAFWISKFIYDYKFLWKYISKNSEITDENRIEFKTFLRKNYFAFFRFILDLSDLASIYENDYLYSNNHEDRSKSFSNSKKMQTSEYLLAQEAFKNVFVELKKNNIYIDNYLILSFLHSFVNTFYFNVCISEINNICQTFKIDFKREESKEKKTISQKIVLV